MIRSGRIVRCDASNALIELDSLSACGSCSSGGCSATVFPGLNPRITVPVKTHCQVGDRVQISAGDPGGAWLFLMLLAYGLPLLGLFLGVIVAQTSGLAEPSTVVVGVLGFIGGLIAWHLVGKTNWWTSRLSPPLSNIRILDNVQEQPLHGPLR